jgi:hypothetical protein
MYDILPYSMKRALELGVKIKPSHNPNKKIDVYDANNQFICSIGDIRYNDFPTYIKKYGMEYAVNRRRLYRIRHKKEQDKDDYWGSPGFYAMKILW